ncbi:hypothetical protein [Sodalis sp. RH16]|uniref:hypothetical protein n=1 Tax=Sodalis sp. RH16 TaxID=3394331 RepID=UPI0039B4323C
MKKITIYYLFILCPLLSIASEKMSHDSIKSSHPDMVASIQIETEKMENKIKHEINRKGNAYNINYDYYKYQRQAIFEKCVIYSSLGGQVAEILENQCELDEVTEFYKFIKTYMASADNN